MDNLVLSTKNIDDFISDVANEVVKKIGLMDKSNDIFKRFCSSGQK